MNLREPRPRTMVDLQGCWVIETFQGTQMREARPESVEMKAILMTIFSLTEEEHPGAAFFRPKCSL